MIPSKSSRQILIFTVKSYVQFFFFGILGLFWGSFEKVVLVIPRANISDLLVSPPSILFDFLKEDIGQSKAKEKFLLLRVITKACMT